MLELSINFQFCPLYCSLVFISNSLHSQPTLSAEMLYHGNKMSLSSVSAVPLIITSKNLLQYVAISNFSLFAFSIVII